MDTEQTGKDRTQYRPFFSLLELPPPPAPPQSRIRSPAPPKGGAQKLPPSGGSTSKRGWGRRGKTIANARPCRMFGYYIYKLKIVQDLRMALSHPRRPLSLAYARQLPLKGAPKKLPPLGGSTSKRGWGRQCRIIAKLRLSAEANKYKSKIVHDLSMAVASAPAPPQSRIRSPAPPKGGAKKLPPSGGSQVHIINPKLVSLTNLK